MIVSVTCLDDNAPSAPILSLAADSGLSITDGVPNIGQITVNGLEDAASWQFSLDNGATWLNGTDASFTLPAGRYAVSSVQVRQTDMAGNVSPSGMLDNLAQPVTQLQGGGLRSVAPTLTVIPK